MPITEDIEDYLNGVGGTLATLGNSYLFHLVKALKVKPKCTFGSGGNGSLPGFATSFLELSDTPDSYTGMSNKAVFVKADGSGLEFRTLSIPVLPTEDYLEIIVGADAPFVSTHIGGYVTKRAFIIKAEYPHIGATDSAALSKLQLFKITPAGVSTLIGTVEYLNKVSNCLFTETETMFNEGDVLKVDTLMIASDCTRLNLTLIGRFPIYDLDS